MDEELLTHRHTNYAFVFLLAVSIFLLTAHLTSYVRSFKNFVFYIMLPTPAAASRMMQAGQDFSRTLVEVVRVHQENASLKEELKRYSYLQSEYRQAVDENLRLRDLVAFPVPPSRKSVIAKVIGREPGGWFQWVIVNRGRRDGVTVDAPVMTWARGRPAVLGRVGEVYEHSSKVILVTSLLSALPATVGSTGEDALLEGRNHYRLGLNYLLPGSRIRVGDEIVTSPLSSIFPPGILIGTVTDITVVKNEEFQSATVIPATNLNSLREVVTLIPVRYTSVTDH